MKRFIDWLWEGITLQHMECRRFKLVYTLHFLLLLLFSITLVVLSLGALLLYQHVHLKPPIGIWAGITAGAAGVGLNTIISFTLIKRWRNDSIVLES